MLPVQKLYSLSASNLVLTSPVRKKLQTSVPAQLTWGGMTLLYLIIVLIRAAMSGKFPEGKSSVCNELVFLIPVIYSSVYMGMWADMKWSIFNQNNASFILAMVLGLACIDAGAMGQYLFTLLFYKKPLSKMAQAAPLRKEL